MTFRFVLPLMALLLAISLHTGCKRKKAPEVSALPAPPPSMATTPDQALAELNRGLELWTFQHNQPPKDLNELVTAGCLQRVPTPPPGRQYVIDKEKLRVVLQ